jgi:hypothetical protein
VAAFSREQIDSFVALLRSDEFKHKGHGRAAKMLGIGRDTVRRLRQDYNIFMDKVERPCANGVHLIAVSEFTKKPNPKKMTPEQSELISKAYPIAMKLAKKLANSVLSEEELLTIAHDAMINSARFWNPQKIGKKLSWTSYAYGGVKTAFRRAFARKRRQLIKEGHFYANDTSRTFIIETLSSFDGVKDTETLVDRFLSMRGPGRFVIEWIGGLHGRSAKRVEDIKRFLGSSATVELVQQYFQEAKQALAG